MKWQDWMARNVAQQMMRGASRRRPSKSYWELQAHSLPWISEQAKAAHEKRLRRRERNLGWK